MKKQLLKKFSAFIVTAMMFSAIANAQIVYTDTLYYSFCSTLGCSDTFNLDINNDGNVDYKIYVYKTGNSIIYNDGVKILSLNGNSITDSTFFLSEQIDSTLLWINTPYTIRNHHRFLFGTVVHHIYTGRWSYIDAYLGLKLIVGLNSYYGWAHLSAGAGVNSASFTIKGYAYNTISDQFILAGDTGTGATGIVDNIASSSINLYPNPAANHLTISLASTCKEVEVIITDITGKIIYTVTEIETQNIEVSTKEFAEGIYLVQTKTGEFLKTQKLIITK